MIIYEGYTLPMGKEYYENLVSEYAKTNPNARVNTYRALQYNWGLDSSNNYKHADSFYKLGPIIISYNNKFLPLTFVRDEEIHDRVEIIPVVYGEESSSDIPNMFISQFSDLELSQMGLRIEPKGLSNPIVKVDSTKLKRFDRYTKLVTNWTCHLSLDKIIRLIDEYTPMTLEYWESQGVAANITPNAEMLMEQLTGAGFNNFVAMEVEQSNGAKGLGVFSGLGSQLYWDFSRRSIGPHIGNNILMMAVKFGWLNRVETLNLGVGYYKWKYQWATSTDWVPSIRLASTEGNLHRYLESLKLNSPPPTNNYANKERSCSV